MSGLLLLALCAAPPQVNFHTKVETRSWEPIRLAEVSKIVERATKEELSRGGLMRLSETKIAELKKGDYKLLIRGRFVEEAERFSVYLSFAPGTQQEAPDLYASDTSLALGRKSRAVMSKRIRKAAKDAAKRLAQAVGPYLRGSQAANFQPATALPFSFGDIEVPEVKDKTPAIKKLLNVRNPDSERYAALREVKPHVLDQQAARNAVERCLLFDPTAGVRKACVEALAPLARTHVPTQRVLLYAARTEVDSGVHSELNDLTSKFVGLSRLETMATWQSMMVDPGTPDRAAEKAARKLGKERNVPNLELSITRCLMMKTLLSSKKRPCVQLVSELPWPARQRLAVNYLRRFPPRNERDRRVFDDLMRSMRERNKVNVPELQEELLQIASSPATGRLRSTVLHKWAEQAQPTPANVNTLLQLSRDTDMASASFRTLASFVRKNDGLLDQVKSGIDRVEGDNRWFERPNSQTPWESLKDLRKRIKYVEKKKNKR